MAYNIIISYLISTAQKPLEDCASFKPLLRFKRNILNSLLGFKGGNV